MDLESLEYHGEDRIPFSFAFNFFFEGLPSVMLSLSQTGLKTSSRVFDKENSFLSSAIRLKACQKDG